MYGNYAKLRVAVEDFSYIYFEEQYIWTQEDFIGALGGILGLWLGLDTIIIIHMLTRGVSKAYEIVICLMGKVESEENVRRNSPIATQAEVRATRAHDYRRPKLRTVVPKEDN